MNESALNVKIPKELKDLVKIESVKEHNTIRAFVIAALKERLDRISSARMSSMKYRREL